MTAKAPTTATPFTFPPHYSFPPFFTRQPNPITRSSQYTSWSELILSYCKHHRLFSLTPIDALDTPLFTNPSINRRLALRDAREILDWMASSEGGARVEWVSGGAGKGRNGQESGAAERCWVYWRRPEEWAATVEAWVDATAQRGSVLTLYELTEG